MAEPDAITSFKLGVELLKGGYPQKALPELRRCVELQSANPYYLSFLGLAIARSDKKWAEAIKLCETALQIKRKELQLHLNLAEVYLAAGQREIAIITLDTAKRSFEPTRESKRQERSNLVCCTGAGILIEFANETGEDRTD